MKRIALITLILCVLMVPVGAGLAVADEHDDEDEPAPPWEEDDEEEEEDDTIVYDGFDDLTLKSYEWDGRTVEMTFEADTRTSFTVADGNALSEIDEGSGGEIPFNRYTLSTGEEETVEFVVGDHGERSVVITQGDTAYGLVEERGFALGSASWTDVRVVGVVTSVGIGTTVLSVATLGYWAKTRDYVQIL